MISKKEEWYVVHTLPGKEQVVYDDLVRRGFLAYLPLVSKEYNRNGKVILRKCPLITNYVFVNIMESRLSQLNFIVGSKQLLCFDGNPVTVTETEISWLKKLCLHNPLPLVTGNYKKGQKLRITGGVLSGIEGEIIKLGSQSKIVICCGLPGYSFELDIENKMFEILT